MTVVLTFSEGKPKTQVIEHVVSIDLEARELHMIQRHPLFKSGQSFDFGISSLSKFEVK